MSVKLQSIEDIKSMNPLNKAETFALQLFFVYVLSTNKVGGETDVIKTKNCKN